MCLWETILAPRSCQSAHEATSTLPHSAMPDLSCILDSQNQYCSTLRGASCNRQEKTAADFTVKQPSRAFEQCISHIDMTKDHLCMTSIAFRGNAAFMIHYLPTLAQMLPSCSLLRCCPHAHCSDATLMLIAQMLLS